MEGRPPPEGHIAPGLKSGPTAMVLLVLPRWGSLWEENRGRAKREEPAGPSYAGPCLKAPSAERKLNLTPEPAPLPPILGPSPKRLNSGVTVFEYRYRPALPAHWQVTFFGFGWRLLTSTSVRGAFRLRVPGATPPREAIAPLLEDG